MKKDNTFRNLYDFNVPVHLFNAIGAITLARTFGLGMDSYIIFLVGEVLLIFFLFVLWLKRRRCSLSSRKGLALVLSRFLVACFLIYSFKWI